MCKCMNNVFVQCELWCDEILRRVARPCCTCSRHVSAQALADLAAPGQQILSSPSCSRADEIILKPCPSGTNQERPCPAKHPTEGCKRTTTSSYFLYSSEYRHHYPFSTSPDRLQECEKLQSQLATNTKILPTVVSPKHDPELIKRQPENENVLMLDTRNQSPIPEEQIEETDTSTPVSFYTPPSTSDSLNNGNPYWHSRTTMFAEVETSLKRTEQLISNKPGPVDSAMASSRIAAAKLGYTTRNYSSYSYSFTMNFRGYNLLSNRC